MQRRLATVPLVVWVLAAAPALAATSGMGPEPRPGTTAAWEETSPGFVVPNDPLLREQWWLFNFGQEIGGQVTGTPDADIRAPEAWSVTTGSPEVIVAILDFGVDSDHPDLDGALWENPGETGDGRETNGVDDDGNGYVDDWRGWDFIDDDNDPYDEAGHGTEVASVVAARGGDAFGITGIAPDVKILPLRVADTGYDQTITPDAIAYASAAGARIVVQSYTSEPSGIFDQSDAETAAMIAHPELLFVTGVGERRERLRGLLRADGQQAVQQPRRPQPALRRRHRPVRRGLGRLHVRRGSGPPGSTGREHAPRQPAAACRGRGDPDRGAVDRSTRRPGRVLGTRRARTHLHVGDR